MTDTPIRYCIVEDDKYACKTLAEILSPAEGFDLLQSFQTAREAVAEIPALAADLVLMDYAFLNDRGFTGVRGVLEVDVICQARSLPKPKCVMHSLLSLSDVRGRRNYNEAMQVGAWGWISKDTDDATLIQTLMRICSATHPEELPPPRGAAPRRRNPALEGLTPRQLQVTLLLAHGYTHKQIAHLLGPDPKKPLTTHAVDQTLIAARNKAGVDSDEALIALVRGELDLAIEGFEPRAGRSGGREVGRSSRQ